MDSPIMEKALEYIRQVPPVPQYVQWAFAGVGALYLGSKLLSYLQLLVSAFLFVGAPVTLPSPPLPYRASCRRAC